MKRTVVAIIGLALSLSVAPLGAHADPEGCVAVGTHAVQPLNTNPWDCFFTATGPSYFTANTTNPFVISISRDGGGSWTDVHRRSRPGPAVAGAIATKPGDRVSVSISCWDYARQNGCEQGDIAGGRDGSIAVQSQP